MSEMIRISTLEHDGEFDAYCARPGGSPRAAIVVIQEIFGVHEYIADTARRFAREVVEPSAGVGLQHGQGRGIAHGGVEQRQPDGVLEQVGEVAGVEVVAVVQDGCGAEAA